MRNVAIVGTGPAGLTAAIYTARAGLKPIIFAGLQHGGQLTTTTEVENFPGFSEGIMGPKLMQDMTAQAERVGAEVVYEYVNSVNFDDKPLKIITDSQELTTHTVIIATGATARTLGLPKEKELMGRGLSTCATCDGFFYKNKKVAVVGGGDSAMEEAMYLGNLCQEVIVLHRRDFFRASKIMLERAQKHPKLKFMLPYTIEETLESGGELTGVRIKNPESGKEQELELDGLFYAIGHEPNSKIFHNYVDVDDHGYIKVTNFTETRTPGVFAAGDICDSVFRQAITAAGMGCQAAMQAARYIENLHG